MTQTNFTNMQGDTVCIGDYVWYNKLVFEVCINDFTGKVVLDGDTGQCDLTQEIADQCTTLWCQYCGAQVDIENFYNEQSCDTCRKILNSYQGE